MDVQLRPRQENGRVTFNRSLDKESVWAYRASNLVGFYDRDHPRAQGIQWHLFPWVYSLTEDGRFPREGHLRLRQDPVYGMVIEITADLSYLTEEGMDADELKEIVVSQYVNVDGQGFWAGRLKEKGILGMVFKPASSPTATVGFLYAGKKGKAGPSIPFLAPN